MIIDFIVKLLRSKDLIIKEEYNTILVIIDSFTKYSHMILFKITYILKEIETILLNKLIWYYGIIKEITSNKDKFFISN